MSDVELLRKAVKLMRANAASWHPAVVLAVADWLEAVADYDMGDTNELESAETVARVYLGRQP